MIELHTCSICGGPYCSICGGLYTGFGNNAQPVAAGRCCDLCNAELVIPERLPLLRNRDAKREGNGGALQ
jgi:hypothetical protein